MKKRDWLEWPFFEDRHRELATRLDEWCVDALAGVDHADTDQACRHLVAGLGAAGWLRVGVAQGPAGKWGGRWPEIDSRALCIVRETLARHDGLADFAFAMQGLGKIGRAHV